MAREWKRAIVTYSGGKSYSIRGMRFRQNRLTKVDNKSIALALEKLQVKGFSVSHEYEDVPDPLPTSPTSRAVRKAVKEQ